MRVVNIEVRRRHLAAVSLLPEPEKINEAEYEGNKLLIDREILRRCNIEIGCELSNEEIKELVLVSESYRAKERAVWYLSKADTTEKALFEKLCRNFSEKAAAFAVAQMVKKGYVNDRRFAENYALLLSNRKVSKRAAVGKMLQKGVPLDMAKEVLSEREYDESIAVLELLKTKYKNKLGNDEQVRKTVAALYRRGFGYSDIKTALNEFSKKEDINV
ncbi:MAG: regulatory protein RecX [Clostridia bacterium]|nr:regulatory protein RecX [Clostridia bacterium]